MIEIGPIVMPCRECDVVPGEPCMSGSLGRGRHGGCRAVMRGFHAKRIRDAAKASELIR